MKAIAKHRKDDATIRFVRKDGTPAAGLKVEAVQRTHDFPFGNLFRPRHYTNELYRARFLDVFNLIKLIEFNWGQYEPDEGQPKVAERRAFIDGWCRTNGLMRFYGHMLTWSYQQDEPRNGLVNPFWLEIWQTCEIFGTQLGYPIYFTEFSQNMSWDIADSSFLPRTETACVTYDVLHRYH